MNGKRASFPCADLNHYPTISLATCDGTRLTFCNAGRLDTIDCTELGFAGCEKGPRDEYVCGPRLPL